MNGNTNNNDPYAGEPEKGNTVESANYEKKSFISDWQTRAIDAIEKAPLSKLYILLSLLVYAVVAFSKKEIGVLSQDVISYIMFSIFVITIYFLILYLNKLHQLNWGKFSNSLLVSCRDFYSFFIKNIKYFLIFLLFLAILFIFLKYYNLIISYIANIFRIVNI